MELPHALNISVHVAAGIFGIGLGMVQLARRKGGNRHQSVGRWFVGAASVVTASAALGLFAFRFMPLFAVLTVLVTYVAVGGLRVARSRGAGPAPFDLWWTLGGIAAAAALFPVLLRASTGTSSQPVVVWSSMGALGLVLAYDLARWGFPRRWFARLWLPEHIYKMSSALFGMASAFAGNVIRWGQPWSQIAPSAIGMLVIFYWWWRVSRRDYAAGDAPLSRATAR